MLELPETRQYTQKLGLILAALPPGDRAQVDGWLADQSVSCDRIATGLTNGGYPISRAAVLAYRTRHA